jgi:hypothetical protein
MAINIRYAAIPAIPISGLTNWQGYVLSALKENVEVLTGARGTDSYSRALIKGQLTVGAAPIQNMTRVSAQGAGYTVSGVTVPSVDDYAKLISDVQTLASDVANLRTTLNTLIAQLKA